jgi:mono/diheme cytochrome c family protein
VRFVFTATNVSSHDVTLLNAIGSCGCTVAKLPEDPRIVPGASGRIDVTMDLKGKYGKVLKTVTVSTDQGVKVLTVAANLPPPTLREIRQDMATTDRQAVFKGQCVNCHVDPTIGKTDIALYTSACGICHESAQRATMVPDLHALPHETGAEFWKTTITHGKAGTMMPAFAQAEGGILSDGQIASLVDYLENAIPAKPQAK